MRSSAAVLALALLTAQQAQQPVIRSRVTMVPLDVRVLDRDGRPIADLTAADFTITEDDVRQTIVHFSSRRLSADPALADAPVPFAGDPSAAAERPDPQNRRVLIVFLSRGRHQVFKHGDALADFITSSLMPQDLVAFTAWNRTTDLSTDHDSLREVAVRFARRHERIETLIREWFEGLRGQTGGRRVLPPHIQKEIDWVFEPAETMRRSPIPPGRRGLADFMRLSLPPGSYSDPPRLIVSLNYLRMLGGEKRLVFITEFGNALLDPRRPGGSIGARAAHDRVALDVLQTGGTIGAPPARFVGPMDNRRISMPVVPSSGALADFMWGLRDIRETAAETGGVGSTLKRGPDAFAQLTAATSHQYLLGYYPSNTAVDGAYRAIKVGVSRRGAHVIARRGYFARPPTGALDVREHSAAARIHQAMTARYALHGIGVSVLNLRRQPDGAFEAELKVEAGHLMPRTENDRVVISLEMVAVATASRNQAAGEERRRVDLSFATAEWETALSDGLVVAMRLKPAGPVRQLKFIAFDYAGDTVGSTIVRIGNDQEGVASVPSGPR